jgi:lipopolysaccharide export system permease protein
VRLITRYLLRQLAAPFCFALAALTAFMLLNQVARRFGNLVGKGLDWGIVAEVFALSVPFIVAMTLPMAVLVAVLYTFSHLAADNETTAMRASGISVLQMVLPVLAWGATMAAVNFAFVDQALPRSNARLRSLLIDIGRKKPTFELREQVINEIPPSQYFLRAARIDAANARLRNVTIYDVGGQDNRRVIYADSAVMGYAPGGTDLSLRLFDGTVHQFRSTDPDLFQISNFHVSEIRVRNVFDQLQRNTDEVVRGDREMGTCEMLAIVDSARQDAARARRRQREIARDDLRFLLGLGRADRPAASGTDSVRLPAYCGWLERARTALLPKTAEAQTPAQGTPPRSGKLPSQGRLPQGSDAAVPVQTPELGVPSLPADSAAGRLSTWSEVATAADRARTSQRKADRFAVEVHKKWAISMACISFVLVGVAMALRFPRGGMGLVIGGGLLVFSIHYVGLTAGEALADRGFITPAVAMWWPDVVLTVVGIWGLWKVSRESGSTRGGDLGELTEWLRALGRRVLRRRRATT